jgi:hypothetical protein
VPEETQRSVTGRTWEVKKLSAALDGSGARDDNTFMSQIIPLESDVYAAADSLARREHRTVAEVVNQVLRRTLVGSSPVDFHPPQQPPPHVIIDPQTGLPSVMCDRSFTSEDVYRIEMDMT